MDGIKSARSCSNDRKSIERDARFDAITEQTRQAQQREVDQAELARVVQRAK